MHPDIALGCLAGTLADTAAVIMCLPCTRSGGYFVPTSDLVLADLTGRRDPHPVYGLARRLADGFPPGASRVMVLFDDLDVRRNWILPPDCPAVGSVWPAVRSAVRAVLPAELADVALLSEWLQAHQALNAYEDAVEKYTQRFLASLTEPKTTVPYRLMTRQLTRRHHFAATAGSAEARQQIRLRAARHLANYAVQGRVMVEASASAYLVSGDEEAEQMGVFAPGFPALTVPPPEPPGNRDGARLITSVIPARYTDLRGSLPLYLADLPKTPGAVVPGMVLDIVAALGKLLTPGTVEVGAAELTALNAVLPGGPANRHRAAVIVDALTTALRPQGGPRSAPGLIGEAARKLFGHLAVRWDDDALTTQHRWHQAVLTHLATVLPDDEPVALAVTGSFTAAPGGWWHPFLSDIDVMPLRAREPSLAQLERLQRIYDGTPRPAWVYLNAGACPGVADIVHDPRRRLFVAEHVRLLDTAERRLLGTLLRPSRFLAGDRSIYNAFQAHSNTLSIPTGEADL
jgi:hypothetical protein